jgi:hypothetical protein
MFRAEDVGVKGRFVGGDNDTLWRISDVLPRVQMKIKPCTCKIGGRPYKIASGRSFTIVAFDGKTATMDNRMKIQNSNLALAVKCRSEANELSIGSHFSCNTVEDMELEHERMKERMAVPLRLKMSKLTKYLRD